MEKESLGLIETLGLIPAIEAADAGTKAANVSFCGYERARAGLITVVFTGDVAAVQAAVSAGSAAAKKVGTVISVHVIARPDRQVHLMRNGSRPVTKAVEVPRVAVDEPVAVRKPETILVTEEVVAEELAAPPTFEADIGEVVEVEEVLAPVAEPESLIVEAVIEIKDEGGHDREEIVEAEEELVVAGAVSVPHKKEKEKARKSKGKRRV
jgi:microcompartment protein CcmL/EutN